MLRAAPERRRLCPEAGGDPSAREFLHPLLPRREVRKKVRSSSCSGITSDAAGPLGFAPGGSHGAPALERWPADSPGGSRGSGANAACERIIVIAAECAAAGAADAHPRAAAPSLRGGRSPHSRVQRGEGREPGGRGGCGAPAASRGPAGRTGTAPCPAGPSPPGAGRAPGPFPAGRRRGRSGLALPARSRFA